MTKLRLMRAAQRCAALCVRVLLLDILMADRSAHAAVAPMSANPCFLCCMHGCWPLTLRPVPAALTARYSSSRRRASGARSDSAGLGSGSAQVYNS